MCSGQVGVALKHTGGGEWWLVASKKKEKVGVAWPCDCHVAPPPSVSLTGMGAGVMVFSLLRVASRSGRGGWTQASSIE